MGLEARALRTEAAVVRADVAARWAFLAAALSVFAVLGFILWVLLSNTFSFFQEVSLGQFLTDHAWDNSNKAPGEARWGIWPLVTGTLIIALGAALIGIPIGLATAVYLSEYASPRTRGIVKPLLEILAGIPSIVFGFFALRVISPWVMKATAPGTVGYVLCGQQADVFNAINAILVVGVMVLPIVTSLSEDALHAVPAHLRQASLGLGATRWETTSKVVLPAALSGIAASFVLGIARAIGETMAVTLAAGAGTRAALTLNPCESMITMTSFIANRNAGDAPRAGPELHAMFAVGFALFLLTLAMNMVARRIVRRYREVDTT